MNADPDKWDRVFGVFGGRFFTLGALFASIAVALVTAFLAPDLFSAAANFADSHHGDIDGYIRAGEMAVAGDAKDAYDREIYAAPFGEATRGLLWYYPPHAFLLTAPLGVMPYILIRPIWIALTILSMALIGLRAGPRSPLVVILMVLSPATFAVLYFLQASAFIALGLTAALLLSPTRPIVAGIILGFLTAKPQYGLLLPVFLAAAGQWRAMGAAAATTVALGFASLAVFGADTWNAYFDSFQSVQETYFALAHPATVSAGQLAAKLGASPDIATLIQLAFILTAAGAVFVAARRLDYRAAVGLTLLLSFAASPSAWPHDWPLAAAAMAAMAAARPNWPLPVQAMALVFWITPFIPLFGLSVIAAPIIVFVFVVVATAWLIGFSKKNSATTPPEALSS